MLSSQLLAGIERCFTHVITEKLQIPDCISRTHTEVAQYIQHTKSTTPAEAWWKCLAGHLQLNSKQKQVCWHPHHHSHLPWVRFSGRARNMLSFNMPSFNSLGFCPCSEKWEEKAHLRHGSGMQEDFGTSLAWSTGCLCDLGKSLTLCRHLRYGSVVSLLHTVVNSSWYKYIII